jgi:hypothetical protein
MEVANGALGLHVSATIAGPALSGLAVSAVLSSHLVNASPMRARTAVTFGVTIPAVALAAMLLGAGARAAAQPRLHRRPRPDPAPGATVASRPATRQLHQRVGPAPRPRRCQTDVRRAGGPLPGRGRDRLSGEGHHERTAGRVEYPPGTRLRGEKAAFTALSYLYRRHQPILTKCRRRRESLA